jgi:hypothetical protein
VSEQLIKLRTQAAAHPYRFAFFGLIGLCIVVVAFATITSSFPDNEIRVASFDPSGNIGVKTNFTIKFTKAMVSKDSLDLPVLNPPLVFMPEVRGMARWVETDVLRFFPDAELAPATEYTVRVESNKTWASGYKIVNQVVYHIRTPLLEVASSRWRTDADPTARGMVRINGYIKFNYRVSRDDLQKKLSIRGDKGAAKSSPAFVVWPAGGTKQPKSKKGWGVRTAVLR